MSSHHFVKEDQEPVLFIVNAVSWSRVSPLLEWCPKVIVSSSVLEQVMVWNIKIDAVAALQREADVLKWQLSMQAPVEILFDSHDDILASTLRFLDSNGHRGVHIIVASASGELLRRLIDLSGRIEISLHEEHFRWSLITRRKFKKWVSGGTQLQVVGKYSGQAIQTEGLKEDKTGFKASSDGLINITSGGPFWVGEEL